MYCSYTGYVLVTVHTRAETVRESVAVCGLGEGEGEGEGVGTPAC